MSSQRLSLTSVCLGTGLFARATVGVDVVSAAMPFEIASRPDELANKLDPFRATSTEISLLFIPGRLIVSVSTIIN